MSTVRMIELAEGELVQATLTWRDGRVVRFAYLDNRPLGLAELERLRAGLDALIEQVREDDRTMGDRRGGG